MRIPVISGLQTQRQQHTFRLDVLAPIPIPFPTLWQLTRHGDHIEYHAIFVTNRVKERTRGHHFVQLEILLSLRDGWI